MFLPVVDDWDAVVESREGYCVVCQACVVGVGRETRVVVVLDEVAEQGVV